MTLTADGVFSVAGEELAWRVTSPEGMHRLYLPLISPLGSGSGLSGQVEGLPDLAPAPPEHRQYLPLGGPFGASRPVDSAKDTPGAPPLNGPAAGDRRTYLPLAAGR